VRVGAWLWLVWACAPTTTTAPPVDGDPEDVPFPLAEVPLTGFVDPLLGTGGPGNTVPGALVPHGMVRASPDTLNGAGAIDAYDYSNTHLEGFSHTHLEGPGGSSNGYSQLLLLPQAGPLELDREARAEAFDHADEVARPGYYAVTMADGVKVELTATGHAAVHRYTFPAGEARLLVDVGHSMGQSVGGEVHVAGAVIEGFGRYNVHPVASLLSGSEGSTAMSTVYGRVEVDHAPTSFGTWVGRNPGAAPGVADAEGAWAGAWLGWTFDAPTVVEVRVGVSRISMAQAERNAAEELGAKGFDEVAAAADAAWNTLLNRVVVDTTPDRQVQLYTALYRSAMQPADYTEAGGRYVDAHSGADVIRQADGYRYFTDDWCLWDTFRTTHPLATLFEPELRDDIATSMLVAYQEGGWLDKCSWHASGYSRVMIGNHFAPVLADNLVKGFDRFDTALAWEALDKAGTTDIPSVLDGTADGLCGYINLGTPPEYIRGGYVPDECDPGQSVSMTLEHAFDDWATARFAEALGRDADRDRYDARGAYWRNTFNGDERFARPRRRDGSWREPFDPDAWGGLEGFTEASSWIYTFFVPHDVDGLIAQLGGPEAFVAQLDQFFDGGRMDASNEPSFHIPWLYTLAGRSDLTSERVTAIFDGAFSSRPDGLPGNDDAGATSSWLVLAYVGLYPMAPGDGRYLLSAPFVRAATLHLHPGFYAGAAVQIEVEGDPEVDRYVQAVTWNGEPVGPWIDHAALAEGGTLRFTVGAEAGGWP
jgi:predicted alpha-1,2-mannosidase